MSIDTMRAKLTDMLDTGLSTTAASGVPIRYENHKFIQPTNGPWMSFHIKNIDAMQANIGSQSRYDKYAYMILVDVLVPEGTGTKIMNDYMEIVARIFEAKSIPLADGEVVITKTAKHAPGPLQFGFYLGTVMIPATRRACKP